MATVPQGEREFAQELGRLARAQLPHMDWEEAEPHLMLSWRTSSHADRLRWSDVRMYARESWGRTDRSDL
jgi:hypothetical protein